MKYIEFGVGNRWLVRTETEREDGSEHEERGIVRPIILQSIYLKIWIGKTVFIIDSTEGFKRQRKRKASLKVIVGLVSK
ncbi:MULTISPECIES: DUF3977 family protein [Sutcliffiella]|uniref:DUF3977 domain-containing protein n=1 Tax=Sutcliffiella cohnii TaxID=33932 RepID=A0A223KNG6_9BACI|nr:MULTISPECIES: DUF3977 family protein [Sutcliffiella]AST90946.1 hypothetical protein BC6307_06455 [Sutcliffiella cohnii]WBL16739.1 DUF3977 family protein [Sutcliffiella sp. NC1]